MCEVLNATSISRCYRRLRASRPRAIDSARKTGLGGSWAGSGRVKNTREEGGESGAGGGRSRGRQINSSAPATASSGHRCPEGSRGRQINPSVFWGGSTGYHPRRAGPDK